MESNTFSIQYLDSCTNHIFVKEYIISHLAANIVKGRWQYEPMMTFPNPD